MKKWLPAPAGDRADLLAFTPVPRKRRAGGWTEQRQREFIAALADTGSVAAAAKRVNMSTEGAYALRRHPDGASFAAAWARVQASGLRRLTDIAIDRATEGVPVPVFYKGEQVGERRAYNDRLLMFLMRQSGEGGTRMGALAAPQPAPAPAAPAAAPPPPGQAAPTQAAPHADALHAVAVWLDAVFQRYERKVIAERRYRLAGEIVAADYTLRQLTHLELILDIGGRSQELIALHTIAEPIGSGTARVQLNAAPLSEMLDQCRQAGWAKAGDPPRPARDLRPEARWPSTQRGDTRAEREAAQREAKARIAAAQAVWEAAATEEGWARFRGVEEG